MQFGRRQVSLSHWGIFWELYENVPAKVQGSDEYGKHVCTTLQVQRTVSYEPLRYDDEITYKPFRYITGITCASSPS